jgi:hypothetical protein
MQLAVFVTTFRRLSLCHIPCDRPHSPQRTLYCRHLRRREPRGRAGLPAQLQDASNRQANDDESNAAATKAGSAPRSCPPRAKWAFIQPRRTAKKASAVMQENEADRERRLRELASKLLFMIERRGSRFALYRDVDV